jgi:endonuclease YncB( thermonuclease family)
VHRRPTIAIGALLAAGALLAVAAPSAASARTIPCWGHHQRPRCHVWRGRVTKVDDGDTFLVRVRHRGVHAIRFLGVQAMELSHHDGRPSRRRGDCNALGAEKMVQRLVWRAHGRVRLLVHHPVTDRQGRWVRRPQLRLRGHWVDLGKREMRTGATLWKPAFHQHDGLNKRFNRLGQRAARRGVGMWNPSRCRRGPAQDVPLRVWTMSWPLQFGKNLDKKWIKVSNRSATRSISLGRWWVRDAGVSNRRFTFPAGTVLAPGQTVTVRLGDGPRSAPGGVFHWNTGDILMASEPHGGLGSGGYLFDPQGDLRAWMVYPCLAHCRAPLRGRVAIKAFPKRAEHFLIADTSPQPIDLYGYQLELKGGGYAFPRGTVLVPGEILRVNVQGSPRTDTPIVKHMGITKARYLPNGGGWAAIWSFDDISQACDAWGSGSC